MSNAETRTLVLLANAPERVAYLKLVEDGTRLVALDPATMEALDADGTPYRTLEEDLMADLVELGERNFVETDHFCSVLDAYLTERSETVRSLGLSFARNLYYELKLLRDAVTLRLHALRRIIEDEAPSAVRLVDGGPIAAGRGLAGLPLYQGLVPAIASALSLPVEVTVSGSTSNRQREPFSLKRLVRALIGKSAYRALSVRASAGLAQARHIPDAEGAVLLVDTGADLAPLLRRWSTERGRRVVWWDGTGLPVSVIPRGLRG